MGRGGGLALEAPELVANGGPSAFAFEPLTFADDVTSGVHKAIRGDVRVGEIENQLLVVCFQQRDAVLPEHAGKSLLVTPSRRGEASVSRRWTERGEDTSHLRHETAGGPCGEHNPRPLVAAPGKLDGHRMLILCIHHAEHRQNHRELVIREREVGDITQPPVNQPRDVSVTWRTAELLLRDAIASAGNGGDAAGQRRRGPPARRP
jgi:hypothetical protein